MLSKFFSLSEGDHFFYATKFTCAKCFETRSNRINRYLEVPALCNQVGVLYVFFDVEVTKAPSLDGSSTGFRS